MKSHLHNLGLFGHGFCCKYSNIDISLLKYSNIDINLLSNKYCWVRSTNPPQVKSEYDTVLQGDSTQNVIACTHEAKSEPNTQNIMAGTWYLSARGEIRI